MKQIEKSESEVERQMRLAAQSQGDKEDWSLEEPKEYQVSSGFLTEKPQPIDVQVVLDKTLNEIEEQIAYLKEGISQHETMVREGYVTAGTRPISTEEAFSILSEKIISIVRSTFLLINFVISFFPSNSPSL